MARLLVKLHGEEVSRITLESGIEYIAGRAQDAQIQLASGRGISRHHLKFYEKDGHWVCESLSKFVMLQKGAASVQVIELGEECMFSIAPYEFHFDPAGSSRSEAGKATTSENLPTFYKPQGSTETGAEHTSPKANNEATVAGGGTTLVPYFRISFPNTADDEVLKLEGNIWVAGRDLTCEIPMDSPHVSRKHFELARTKEGFFITDLGSSNGTKVNGQRIPPHEPTRIESGDEVSIKNIDMAFEIRDVGFNKRVDNLPMQAFDPMLAAPPAPWHPPQDEGFAQESSVGTDLPRSLKEFRLHHLRNPEVRKKAIRISTFILIPILLVSIMMPSKPKSTGDRGPTSTNGNNSVSFDKLTVEQRSIVKDSFNLARNLYVQGKYELCLTELAKLHELIPLYENSKELQSFCEQGRELVHRQRDQDRKERERAQIEQQISGYVEACKAKLNEEGSVDEIRQCLAEAMELDPEHHLIVEMIHGAQMHEEERKFAAEQKKTENKKTQRGMAHYGKAKELYKSGQLAKAAAEYERYINTPYPHSDGNKNAARRELASVKQELKSKIDTMLEQCKSLGGKGQFRDAYMACSKALEEDRSNVAAKESRNQMMSELKRELKNVYEDSVLEESLGNVDSAKEKWKKIMKDDVPSGEYFTKAKGKLQKYGVGN